ncbi:hypothetical protein P691DRAFT_781204 [Macrolepiota fuliginosa MF-IS2]|uniref:Uncharacterized protein n=1 Tax=Macrolepiota fuliginosa MF-IS2 TaxID=1400762 RepID=A0A9P5WXE6_9AGAR|nr:hypothetical protein P691DRAFT_781204 [Macrolepiota fuliginosa MF-IS2]
MFNSSQITQGAVINTKLPSMLSKDTRFFHIYIHNSLSSGDNQWHTVPAILFQEYLVFSSDHTNPNSDPKRRYPHGPPTGYKEFSVWFNSQSITYKLLKWDYTTNSFYPSGGDIIDLNIIDLTPYADASPPEKHEAFIALKFMDNKGKLYPDKILAMTHTFMPNLNNLNSNSPLFSDCYGHAQQDHQQSQSLLLSNPLSSHCCDGRKIPSKQPATITTGIPVHDHVLPNIKESEEDISTIIPMSTTTPEQLNAPSTPAASATISTPPIPVPDSTQTTSVIPPVLAPPLVATQTINLFQLMSFLNAVDKVSQLEEELVDFDEEMKDGSLLEGSLALKAVGGSVVV